jgi:ATP synthase F1 gamma subunit
MAKLRNLRAQLAFNKDMSNIINVLRGIAASEFGRLQRERKKFDEYASYLERLFQILDVSGFSHFFLDEIDLPTNIILVTSDTGFLGKLNVSIVNTALGQYKENDYLTVIGRQGERYITERVKEYKFFPGISDYISPVEVERIKKYIINEVKEKHVNKTVIVYPEFVSFAVQRVQSLDLLPCRHLFTARPVDQIQEAEEERLIVEPSFNRVVEYLVHLRINHVIYNIFWESKLSEWAARVMHLEGSSDEVKRQAKVVRLSYFRAVHEQSDKSIREIFASTSALRRSQWNKYES